MRKLLVLVGALALGACSVAQQQRAAGDLAEVQLYCQAAQGIVAIATTTGTPVLAKGEPKAYVDAACALAGGVAVSPPTGGAPGVITVQVPQSALPK